VKDPGPESAMKNSILIVDDDKNTCMSIARALSANYRTYTASSGYEAIKILNRNKDINIVLSDVVMNDMSGIDLLEKIHIMDDKIIVIMITGFTEKEPAVQAKQLGAYDYITKPLDLNRLEVSIKNSLEKARI
jgi:DNA-binding NtrC family response regulator